MTLRSGRRVRLQVLVLAMMAITRDASVARAQWPLGCDEARVRIEGPLSQRWLRALPVVCAELNAMADADRQAKLVLRPVHQDLLVTVLLQDGRVTERRIHRTSELMPTVEALVAVPSPPADHQAHAPTAEAAPVVPEAVVPSAPASPRRLRYELGLGAMSRIDGRPTYLSLGLQGYAALHVAWLMLALVGRWDGFQSVVRRRPAQLEMSTEGIGLWVLARAAERAGISLDAGLSLWVLGIMQTRGEYGREDGGDTADMRVGSVLRLLLGRAAFRTSLGLDFEVSPLRLHRSLRLEAGLPTLPSFSLGLTLGFAWQAS